MLIRRQPPGHSADIRPSEITSEDVYLNRRALLQAALAAGLTGLAAPWAKAAVGDGNPAASTAGLKFTRNEKYSLTERPNTYDDITTYNNYYEFGVDKSAPSQNSGRFKPSPWSVSVAGEAETTGTFTLED